MNINTIKLPFKVSARAGKLLGRENFSNPEGAITELVKNSYDADAENCLVIFDIPLLTKKDENDKEYFVPDKKNSLIYIIDNGDGMEQNIVEEYYKQTGIQLYYGTFDGSVFNRAAARNFGATAASQLGQWSQTKEKMRNQARRDRQILPYLQNFLRYGTVNSLVDSLTV